MHIFLTPAAHDGLRDFCKRQGIDVTAFLEALGQGLAERERPGSLRATVEAAKVIHRERHKRA